MRLPMRAAKPLLLALCCACAKAPAPEPSPPTKPKPPLKVELSDQPETCRACHPTIYDEWIETTHAQSHHSKDPLFAAVRQLRVAQEGAAVSEACGQCHYPRSTAAPDTAAARTGVSCATCHNVRALREGAGQYGARRLLWALPDQYVGPHAPKKKNVEAHRLAPVPEFMKDSEKLCRACHESVGELPGVPLCASGHEWSKPTGNQNCVSCHMPLADGPGTVDGKPAYHRSHRFVGPRSGARHAKSAPIPRGVEVTAELKGRRLRVKVVNKTTHTYPSGYPGRWLILNAEGYDANGRPLWIGTTRFNRSLLDQSGQLALSNGPNVEVSSDRRLQPGETRTFDWEVSPGVQRAAGALELHLLSASMAERLGVTSSTLLRTTSIARFEVRTSTAP